MTRLTKVTVRAPAKLNLALDVLGTTPDGYHTLDMIMQAIDVWERVEVARSTGYSLRLPGSRVPAGDKNTATRAAEAFFRETGLLAGADITLHKSVPTRAGMAGGSADAAGVLVALNELYGARLPLPELCRIGLAAGADVPFALMGGTARVGGIGEELRALPPLGGCWFAIAMPPGGMSTPLAFARYDRVGAAARPDVAAAEAAIRAGDLTALAGQMANALERAGGGELTDTLRHTLDGVGALASMMTGSGAAVFGLFDAEAPAREAAALLRALVPQVFVAQPVAHGPEVTDRW